MFRTMFVCAIFTFGVQTSAVAQADPIASYYGNTVHETREDGTQSWFMFDASGSFQGQNSSGRIVSGKYIYDPVAKQNCLVMPPRPAGAVPPTGRLAGGPPCAPMPSAKVGDSWDRVGPTALKEHFALEAGNSAPPAATGATPLPH